MPTHIVLFTLSLRTGGTERQVANLARALHQNGFRVSVITIFPDHTVLTDELSAAGIQVYSDWFTGGFGFLTGILKASRYMHVTHVAIVHIFLMAALPFALPAAMLSRVPVRIASERASTRPLWPHRRRWLYRLLLHFVQQVEANTYAGREILIVDEHIAAERIVVHRNIVQLERFEQLPPPPQEAWVVSERMRIGTVAHLRIPKNVLLLAKSAALFIDEYPTVDIVHVGTHYDLKLEQELSAFVQQHLGNRWITLGGRDNPTAVMCAFDIFVLSSDWEGMPNAMLEAMACGLPVVTTNFSDAADILKDSGGGFVVPVGDEKALAAALRQLLDDPELRRRMGQANRAWIFAHMKQETILHEVVTMYNDLLWRYGKNIQLSSD